MNKNIKKLLSGVKENVSLKNYSTFRIGGKAEYFFIAKSKDELVSAILIAKKLKLPLFILGNGSNLLISDKGFNGLVIRLQVTGFRLKMNAIYAEAGVFLNRLVSLALENNLSGLEWAAGIPGTLGGAIYGNAGAFGKSMGDNIKEVEVLDIRDLRFKIYDLRKCKFGYRDSIFKKKNNLIILSAEIKLRKGNKKEIKDKMKEYLDYRKRNQPLNFPSIGSIFKNPSPAQISKKFMAGRGFSAGELIEKCGLKGKKIGNVKISEKHANFIINLGNGKAADVKKLINLAKKKVKEKFGINLKEEIQYLPR